jgi:hypothetical protein
MHRLFLAIRAFFRVLANRDVARHVAGLLDAPADVAATPAPSAAATVTPERTPKPAPAAPARSEALTLLATLQREARFVDFIEEPLGAYSDAQIGAAARDVHRHCGEVVRRVFALEPVVDSPEGAEVDVPDGAAATRFHLLGNVGAPAPRRGKLCHKGWQATQCQLPQWTGGSESKWIVAPAEVELK